MTNRRSGGGRGDGGRGRTRSIDARGLASAALLAVAGMSVGWLSFKAAMVRALPPTAPLVARFAPGHPETVLANASAALVARHGILDTATLDAVRRAAAAAPLDARAYLILGHQHLLEREPARATATFEAGQRLDPRQRLIHLLLLDRYLRTGRYADSATQLSLLSRLMGGARNPIAAAMAQMTMAPETRDAVRRTLRSDAALERGVLVALAKSDVAPDAIFALAGPAARADARASESWGPALVGRLVAKGDYAAARSAWQRIYGMAPAQATALVTNADFRDLPPAPPFDWTLTADSLGAADIRAGSLAIDYYGRDSGTLASQLLLLRPGRYRFAVTVDPGKTDTASRLLWSITCGATAVSDDRAQLMNLAVGATAKPRRIGADFTIPSGCPAQTLRLRGEAGDFPAPIALSVRDLDLRPLDLRAPPEATP